MDEQVETEGVAQVGEVVTRVLREVYVEQDYRNAWIAGATQAFRESIEMAVELIGMAGPYDDIRGLQTLAEWMRDKIQTVNAPPRDG